MKRGCLTAAAALFCLCMLAGPAAAKELVIGTIGLTGDTYQMAIAWSNLMLKKGGDLKLTPVDGGGDQQDDAQHRRRPHGHRLHRRPALS